MLVPVFGLYHTYQGIYKPFRDFWKILIFPSFPLAYAAVLYNGLLFFELNQNFVHQIILFQLCLHISPQRDVSGFDFMARF